MDNNNNIAKRIVLEFLEFIKYKVENDKLSMRDVKAVARMFEENLTMTATLDELSDYYGKNKEAVRSVIKRRMFQKPIRNVVLYPFHVFRKLVPSSWHLTA